MGGTEGHCTGGATKQTLHLFHGARGAPADRTLREGPGGGGGLHSLTGLITPLHHTWGSGESPPLPPLSRGVVGRSLPPAPPAPDGIFHSPPPRGFPLAPPPPRAPAPKPRPPSRRALRREDGGRHGGGAEQAGPRGARVVRAA